VSLTEFHPNSASSDRRNSTFGRQKRVGISGRTETGPHTEPPSPCLPCQIACVCVCTYVRMAPARSPSRASRLEPLVIEDTADRPLSEADSGKRQCGPPHSFETMSRPGPTLTSGGSIRRVAHFSRFMSITGHASTAASYPCRGNIHLGHLVQRLHHCCDAHLANGPIPLAGSTPEIAHDPLPPIPIQASSVIGGSRQAGGITARIPDEGTR